MSEANLLTLGLSEMNPAELEQERRRIVQSLTTDYRGYDDDSVPRELLQRLAVITATLRRKNAGPPKATKGAPKTKQPASLQNVLDML